MKNNKGFTLVELIATIVILSIVLSITGFAITGIMESAREKNYNLLITDINSAAELYYQECKYNVGSLAICDDDTILLGDLVKYGYLTSNATNKDEDDETPDFEIINPKTEDDISGCEIKIELENGKIKVNPIKKNGCPEAY